MAVLSPENEGRLRVAIAEYELQDLEDLILRSATECAILTTTEPDDYSRPGSSRFGGRPDLPQSVEWPRSGNRRFRFLIQINFAEVPAFEGKLLPDRGMLYVFTDDWEATLIYSPAENSAKLIPATAEDDTGASSNPDLDALTPYRLSIQAAVDLPEWTSDAESAIIDALEASHDDPRSAEDSYHALVKQMHGKDRHWAGKLQGQPCWIGYVPDWQEWSDKPAEAPSLENGWMLLLLMDSNNDVDILFGDAGYQMEFIQREALQRRDFSNIYSQLESS
ncbi:MAG: YwqG family protein [Armatimonadota bacterium]